MFCTLSPSLSLQRLSHKHWRKWPQIFTLVSSYSTITDACLCCISSPWQSCSVLMSGSSVTAPPCSLRLPLRPCTSVPFVMQMLTVFSAAQILNLLFRRAERWPASSSIVAFCAAITVELFRWSNCTCRVGEGGRLSECEACLQQRIWWRENSNI